jgi:hypothetical protein
MAAEIWVNNSDGYHSSEISDEDDFIVDHDHIGLDGKFDRLPR